MKKQIRFLIACLLAGSLFVTTSCSQMADNVAKKLVESRTGSEEPEQTPGPQIQTSQPDTKELPSEEEVPDKKKPPISVTVSGEKRVVAYYTSWSAYARSVLLTDVDVSKLTHINFAFANLAEDGSMVIGDSWVDVEMPMEGDGGWAVDGLRGHYRQLQLMKEKNPGLKTLISVGGWTWSKNFSGVAADAAKRQQFAQSAVKFVTEYGFDGVDIDWEFPVEGGDNIPHLPEDKQNYTLLLADIRAALDAQGEKDGKHYLLTIAGGPNPSFVENTELTEIVKYVDFINVMSYDYHGGWETVTGHNAPLYASEGLSVDATIQAYLDTGIEPSMLNLGLAFYGRGWQQVTDGKNNGLGNAGVKPGGTGTGAGTWEGGVFDYWDLEQNYLDKNGYERYFDEEALVPYLYNGESFITYDDAQSIGLKVDYALANGLGGVMYWEFSGDKQMVLQDVIMSKFGTLKEGGSLTVDMPQKTESNRQEAQKDKKETETSSYPQWSSEAVYNSGDTVTFEGSNYRAKWWTQNEKPSPDSSEGVWEKIP